MGVYLTRRKEVANEFVKPVACLRFWGYKQVNDSGNIRRSHNIAMTKSE